MKLGCIDKAHQSILKNPTADRYGHIRWTDQKTNQSNYRKKACRQKRSTIEQLVPNLVHAEMKTSKQGSS